MNTLGNAKRLVLLADDSVRMHRAVALGLRDQPYELLSCDNGSDALRLTRERKPSVVLADLDMPGLTGIELIAAIRQEPALQRVKVVLLCNSLEPVDEESLRQANPDAKLWKPFEPQALVALLLTLLKSEIREATEATQAVVTPPPRPKIPLPKRAPEVVVPLDSDAPTDPLLNPTPAVASGWQVPSAQEESNEDPVPDIARDMTFETFREAAQVQEHSHPSEPSHFSTAPSAPEATENLSSGEDLWGVSAASSLNDTPIDLPRFEEADEYQIVTNPEIFVPQDGDSEAPAAAAVSAPEMVAPTDEVLSRWASDFSQQPQAQQSQTQLAPSGNEDLKEWVRQEFESKFREELRQLLKEELNAVLKELGEST